MDRSEKFWDRTAKTYSNRLDENDEIARSMLAKIREYLKPKDTVLDFGCATGLYAFEIAPFVVSVWGIDTSAQMIAAGIRNAGERNITNIQFLQASIHDARLAQGSFDVILAINVLHLVNEAQGSIGAIRRLLKPGGFFISNTPCMDAGTNLIVKLIKLTSFLGITPSLNVYKPADVISMISGANFEIIESQISKDVSEELFAVARKTQ